MPKIVYVRRVFSSGSMATIDQANAICEDYAAQGYDLTLELEGKTSWAVAVQSQ